MKIYRFVPDALRFRPVELAAGFRWWPQGLDLGPRADRSYPATLPDTPWPYAGNRYHTARDARPDADVPALALNLLVGNPRALAVFRGLRGVDREVPLTIDSAPAAALQLRALRAFDVERSQAITAPGGEPLFFTRRSFVEREITADAFWIASAMPFSDVYVTETFRAAAQAAGLTGLGFLELVHDDSGPVVTRHVPPTGGRAALFGPRYDLEHGLLLARADALGYSSSEVTPIIERAYLAGEIPATYPPFSSI
jgi:hypothetical protein